MDFRLSEEQEMFRKSVRDYVNRELPKSWARDLEKDEHTFPHELFGKLATAGFHAIGIPEEYGGQGGDIMTQMLLARELARSLAGLTWVWGITSFAGGKSVGIYGTPEQKQQHLPAIAAGREKWAIGFTEPGGGTDVLGAMRTVATRVDGGWIINGQKTWSSMAHADLIVTKAAWLQSRGLPCQREATMAKVIASELANQAADLGIQILGGMGYSAETDMQRYWRDSRLFRIGPITNEMARNSIAEGLGLPRSF